MKNAWTENDIPDLSGKRAIVTGPGGLGFEVGRMLAGAGAEVILAGRDPTKGEASVQAVRGLIPDANVRFEKCDLADLASVLEFATRMNDQAIPIDILVNNAGVMAPPQRLETTDGFELQMGTNYLGHFALTSHLLGLLQSANGARVVNVASLAHRQGKIQFDDMQWRKTYKAWSAYGQSKLAMLMFGLELQRKSDANGWGIISCPAHPGAAVTDLMANGPGERSFVSRISQIFAPLFFHNAQAGALPITYAAASNDVVGGGYYGPGGMAEMKGAPSVSKISKTAQNREAAARLWDVSLDLTGVSFS